MTGDPTEAALLVLAAKAGGDLAAIHRAQPRLKVFPFESVRKRMSTVNSASGGGSRSWVKGAPEPGIACLQVGKGLLRVFVAEHLSPPYENADVPRGTV